MAETKLVFWFERLRLRAAIRKGDQRVLTLVALVAASSILVKAGTAVRELLVGWYFGLTEPMDAYVISYAVPYFLTTLLGSALPQVFVPAYVRARTGHFGRAAENLSGLVLLLATALLVTLALAVGFGAPLYLPLLGRGFSDVQLLVADRLAVLLAPTLVTSVLISMAGAILNAHGKFLAPAVSPLLTTATVVATLTLFVAKLGIYALALGTLFGTTAELLLLAALVRRETSIRLDVGSARWTRPVRDMAERFGVTLIGAALMAATMLIDQAMSSGLGSGSVAALNYATRLVTVPLSLTAAALGTVVLPYFSTLVAQREWLQIRHTVRRYLGAALLLSTPLALALAVYAAPITDLLLVRGAFNADNAITVARTVSALALAIPSYTCVVLLLRLALALHLNLAIAFISAVNLALNIALNAWLSSVLGVAGIALSTSAVYALSFGLLYAVTQQRISSRLATGVRARGVQG